MPAKWFSGYFLFCLDLELLMKIVLVIVSKPGYFEFLQITHDLNQTKKKSQTPFCRQWKVGTVCKILAKNIQLYSS